MGMKLSAYAMHTSHSLHLKSIYAMDALRLHIFWSASNISNKRSNLQFARSHQIASEFWFSPSSYHTITLSDLIWLALTLTTICFKIKLTYGWLIIYMYIVLSVGRQIIKVGQISIWASRENFRRQSRTRKCDLAYLKISKEILWTNVLFVNSHSDH